MTTRTLLAVTTILAACGGADPKASAFSQRDGFRATSSGAQGNEGEDGQDPANARIRIVHASPDAPNVDVLIDGEEVLTNVPFKAFSGYLPIESGARRIEVRATGADEDVIDVTPSFAPGTDTTVLAAGKVAKIAPLPLADDNTPPAKGKVKVRIVHGAPSAPAVDVYVTAPAAALGSPVLASVPFKAASGYLSVPAGTYRIRVTPAGSKTVVIDSGAVTLAAGQIRTVVAVDAVGGGAPFGAIVLADLN